MRHDMEYTDRYTRDIHFLSLFIGLLLQLLPASVKAQVYCNVRTFSMNDGLAANLFSSIGQTKDGLMWFGTWNGLSYFDGYTCGRLPANLLQAQRDYFGAHTYERTDCPRGQFFHTDWTGHGGDTAPSTYNA